MHVILMSGSAGRTVAFRLRRAPLVAAAVVTVLVLVAAAIAGFSLAPRQPTQPPAVADLAQAPQLEQLAMRVGELQARVARLNAVGERVARKAGLPVGELAREEAPGRGGPLDPLSDGVPDIAELSRLLDQLAAELAGESDRLLVMESELVSRQVRQGKLVMDTPVGDSGYLSSPFGVRLDPFTGRRARHHGIDFADAAGAPVLAAESGVVVRVESHPQFGHMLDIDHGNGLVTRYGHTQRVFAKPGDLVKRGQAVAEVGSTGRSTGPHLHFEVLKNGAPINPQRFLAERS